MAVRIRAAAPYREDAGAIERMREVQVRGLGRLLDPQRMQRMIEAEVFLDGDTYTLLELLDYVRAGVWSELWDGCAIDAYRRNVQRGYLQHMEQLITKEAAARSSVGQSDVRPFVRGQLQECGALLTAIAAGCRIALRGTASRICPHASTAFTGPKNQ